MNVLGDVVLKNKRGVTLIELLIGVVLISMVITVISRIAIVSFRSQQRSFEQTVNLQAGRQIMMAISDEIRNAVSISSPDNDSLNSITYRKNNDTANRKITIGSGTDANTVIFTDPTGTVVKKLGAGRIQTLQFTRLATQNEKVKIDLTIHNTAQTNAPTNTISSAVYTLNDL